jgi:hypothetical protein
MTYFNFTLDSFSLTQTRSKHLDTNYVLVTVKQGSLTPRTMVQRAGDVNNGAHSVELALTGIEVEQDDSIILNYLIVNAGSGNTSAIEGALNNLGVNWANGQGPSQPPFTSALGADNDWFDAQLRPVLTSPCDGMVAAEQNRFSFGDLASLVQGSRYTHQTAHSGTSPRSGCGGISRYTANWRIDRATQVPEVIGFATDTPGSHPARKSAAPTLQNAGFRVAWQQGTKGPVVIQQNPPGLFFAIPGSSVTLWRGTTIP